MSKYRILINYTAQTIIETDDKNKKDAIQNAIYQLEQQVGASVDIIDAEVLGD